MTAKAFAAQMPDAAVAIGLPKRAAPKTKALLDAINGRNWPKPTTMLIAEHLTGGDVSLTTWVRDLYRRLG